MYEERDRILRHANMTPHIVSMIRNTIATTVQRHTGEGYFEDWDIAELVADMGTRYPTRVTVETIAALNEESLTSGKKDDLDADDITQIFVDDALEQYQEKTETYGKAAMQKMERQVLLASLDRRWKEHLHEMDYLKSGIGLRGFAQKDPITEYRQEGYELFHLMLETVKEETTRYVFYIHPHTGATEIDTSAVEEVEDDTPSGLELFGIKPINPSRQNKFLEETETDFPLFFNLDEVDKILSAQNDSTPENLSAVSPGGEHGETETVGTVAAGEELVFSGPSETGGENILGEKTPPTGAAVERDLSQRASARKGAFATVDAEVGARNNPDVPHSAGVQVKYVAEGDDVPIEYRGVAKNAKCPCGSGKKFKRCHGQEIFA